jgi:hypothetical protein
MKGYSEQRGVQTQVIYDAVLDQFLQSVLKHDFLAVTEASKEQSETASITELPRHKARAVDKSSLHRGRAMVTQIVQKQRAG